MKGMTFKGSMLLALLFTAGLVFAQEQAAPSGDTYTFDFPVTLQGQSIGTVTIDAKHRTFEFAAEDLDPRQPYDLVCTQLQRSLGSAEATKTGTLRMKDKWDPWFWDGLTEAPTFVLVAPTPVLGCSIPTHLTLSFYTIGLWGNAHGKLTVLSSGNPVGGMVIRITEGWACHTDSVNYVTTDSNGEYSYTRFFWIPECAYPSVVGYFDGNSALCAAKACDWSTCP